LWWIGRNPAATDFARFSPNHERRRAKDHARRAGISKCEHIARQKPFTRRLPDAGQEAQSAKDIFRPSSERIAEAASCARSTVAEAIAALEDAGILSWVQRIKRVRERCSDLLGANVWRWRVLRTSNAYNFRDPGTSDPSKSEKPV
jgi:hypothetical protein